MTRTADEMVLEPEALAEMLRALNNGLAPQDVFTGATVSLAISARRIADAICEGTAAIHVHINTDGVAGGIGSVENSLRILMYDLGREFARGAQ